MSKEDGGLAFPLHYKDSPNSSWTHEGMTLRDYLAAHSASGMFAAFRHWPRGGECQRVAELAYEAADAMLEARKK